MGKVSEKILSEANERKKNTIKAAKKKAEEILKDASLEAKEIKTKGKEKGKRVKKREIERNLSQVRLMLKTEKLKVKNEIVNDLKKRIEEEIKKLNWSSLYKPFIEDLILKASESRDEEIIPGTLFEDEVKTLVKSLNEKEGNNFKISKKKADFEAGVILLEGKKRINASFPILLEESIDELEEDIVKLLFSKK